MEVRVLGTTDDVTTCDCCGRADLKATVALSIDDGEPVYFGVVCAARATKRDAKFIRTAARAADNEREKAERKAREAERSAKWLAETLPWFAFLDANGKGTDRFTQMESLGGYKVARAAFEATRKQG